MAREERLAREAFEWHRKGKLSKDTRMPCLLMNREVMNSWSPVERQRYFESGGLYLPATKQLGPPPDAADREARTRPRRRSSTQISNQMGIDDCIQELREYFKMAERAEPFRVAMVGNGPLSEKCRKQVIEGNFDIVVRFNDQKNYRVGDAPTTLHVARFRVDSYDAPFCGLALYKRHAPLLLLGNHALFKKPLNEFEGIYPCPDGKWYDVAASFDLNEARLFPDEPAADFLTETNKHPSAGLWALGLFQMIEEVSEIHTFGMNWAFNGDEDPEGGRIQYNHSDEEGALVKSHVFSKIKIHPPPSTEYDPTLEGGVHTPPHTCESSPRGSPPPAALAAYPLICWRAILLRTQVRRII